MDSNTKLNQFLQSLSQQQLTVLMAAMMEDDVNSPYVQQNANLECLTSNFDVSLTAGVFQDAVHAIEWCFDQLLADKAYRATQELITKQPRERTECSSLKRGEVYNKVSIQPYLYYSCLVYSLSYFIKDFNILDELERFIGSVKGYVPSDKLTTISFVLELYRVLRIIDTSYSKCYVEFVCYVS